MVFAFCFESIQIYFDETFQNVSIYLPLINKNGCLSVCLFVLYAFGHSTYQCCPNVQEASSHPGKGRETLFPRKFEVLSPFCFRPMELHYILIHRRTGHQRFSRAVSLNLDSVGWNPISWRRTNGNSVFENSLNLNGIGAETVLEEVLEATRLNLMSIRLKILMVKLEPISDKQLNPFRLAIRKMPNSPTVRCYNLAISARKRFNSFSGSKGCKPPSRNRRPRGLV